MVFNKIIYTSKFKHCYSISAALLQHCYSNTLALRKEKIRKDTYKYLYSFSIKNNNKNHKIKIKHSKTLFLTNLYEYIKKVFKLLRIKINSVLKYFNVCFKVWFIA